MRILNFLAALLVSFSAAQAAPVIIDDSGESFPEDIVQKLTLALTKEGVRDPLSAQFHSLQPGTIGNYLCGYVNLKNGYGAYVGFQPFQMNIDKSVANILDTQPHEISWNLARLVFTFSGCADLLELPPEN